MSRPRIGALRHRLSLESATRTSDGGGGAVVTWSLIAQLWGDIAPATGAENVVAESINGHVSHVVHMRYRNDIAPAMRLRFGPRILEILAVFDSDGRGRFLQCRCLEKNL